MQAELPTLKTMLSNELIADNILKYLDFDTLVKLKKAFKEDTALEPTRSQIMIVDYYNELTRPLRNASYGLDLTTLKYLGNNNIVDYSKIEYFNYIDPRDTNYQEHTPIQKILDELTNVKVLKLHTEA